MAERRMFSKQIIDSDAFLDMPLSTQALYFHLSMRADDEGFINKPKMIMRMVGASQNELELLLSKRYILAFESGVIVIKHWKIHNYIQKDRFKETLYLEEKNLIEVKGNKSYTEKELNESETEQNTNVSNMDTKYVQNGDTGKVRLGKVSIDKNNMQECEAIIAYLNSSTGSSYRPKTQSTVKHIKARLNEGFTVDDFKTVISKKIKEWSGTDMVKYLRPETLFGAKFESYLNQKETRNHGKFHTGGGEIDW